MRKILLTLGMSFCILNLNAQTDLQKAAAEAAAAMMEAPEAEQVVVKKPVYWTNSVQFNLGFNQTGLFNWAAGGYNTLTLNSGIDAKANYAKNQLSFNNRLQLQYGFLWAADKKNLLQKSNDLMYLESGFSYKTEKKSKWNYAASFSFRSQFADSYDKYVLDDQTNTWSGTLKSGLFSPAYTNIAIGMEWIPNSWFNVNIAPLTGGFTICSIPELRKKYGMKLIEPDLDAAIGDNYKSMLFQFGAQVKANFKMKINDNFNYETQLVLFTDYLNRPFRDTRVNWDNKISFLIGKFFKVGLDTWLIYDPIVKFDDGSRKVQFKEFFSINFTYTISNK